MLGVALRDQHGLGESRMCWARCSVAETSRNSSNADEVAAGRRKGKVQNARLADPSRVKLRSKLEIPALLCLSYSNSKFSAHARAAGDPLCFSRWARSSRAHSCALGFPADIDWGSVLLVVQYVAISRTYVSIYICIERYDVHFYSYQL